MFTKWTDKIKTMKDSVSRFGERTEVELLLKNILLLLQGYVYKFRFSWDY